VTPSLSQNHGAALIDFRPQRFLRVLLFLNENDMVDIIRIDTSACIWNNIKRRCIERAELVVDVIFGLLAYIF